MDMINEIGRWLQEKEVLPTALERLGMADKLAEIVLISLGITVLLNFNRINFIQKEQIILF